MRFRATLIPAKGRASLILALAAALAAALLAVSTVGIDPAEAKKKASGSGGKIVFVSDRTTVDNPDGDREIFITNTDGKEPKQLTKNAASDFDPVLSPDGQKVAYTSVGVQTSNPEGDAEVYLINADGTGQLNLSNNGAGIDDATPDFSPDGQKLVYQSEGVQTSNPEGDGEVYLVNADGSGRLNLTDNTATDSSPNWGK